MDCAHLRADFPILDTQVHGQPLVYLDSAATMQMPLTVQRRMERFYRTENANIHRGIHSLSEGATAQYESVRSAVDRFLDAGGSGEILFTAGTTASVNLAATMLEPLLRPGDEILVTGMEHHSNFLPWQQLAKRSGAAFRVAPVYASGQLDMERFMGMVNSHTRVAALSQRSNLTGIAPPAEEMISSLRQHSGAYVLVDGAQGIGHDRVSLRALQPDFYCFSGHKLGAPTGVGVLWVRKPLLSSLRPVWFGGGTVSDVREDGFTLLGGPSAFEQGTPNYAGVIGLGAALDYWAKKETVPHETALMARLEQGLRALESVRVLGDTPDRRGCISVTAADVHSYDLCRFLDQYGIAARSGHLCALPYLRSLGEEHALRFSVVPYNTMDEIEYTLSCCREILQLLRGGTGHGHGRNRKRHIE